MNGGHDVGGKHGLGPIHPEKNEPVWHYGWEGRMYVLAFFPIAGGVMTIDEKRHAIERMPHAWYLSSSYYEHWLHGIEKVLDEKGFITKEEMDQRVKELGFGVNAPHPKFPVGELDEFSSKLLGILKSGTPHDIEVPTNPLFKNGQAVRARNLNPKVHLRLPAYAKGRTGRIQEHIGGFTHPRDKAHGMRHVPVHLYRVEFTGQELWGPDAERADDVVYLDLCEDYLEAAV